MRLAPACFDYQALTEKMTEFWSAQDLRARRCDHFGASGLENACPVHMRFMPLAGILVYSNEAKLWVLVERDLHSSMPIGVGPCVQTASNEKCKLGVS